MHDVMTIYIPTMTPVLWQLFHQAFAADDISVFVGAEAPELDDVAGPGSGPRFYQLLDTSDAPPPPSKPDLAILDTSDPSDVYLDTGFLPGSDLLADAGQIITVLGVHAQSTLPWDESLGLERVIPARPLFHGGEPVGVELIHSLTTDATLLQNAIPLFRGWGLPATVIWVDVPGGATVRMRAVLDTEVWAMVRTGVAEPSWANALSAELLGSPNGVLADLRARDPRTVWQDTAELAHACFGDGRFRPNYDAFPPATTAIWDQLLNTPSTPPLTEESRQRPGRVLVAGSPHLVNQWVGALYTASGGKVNAVGWDLWDLGSVTDTKLLELKQAGPFDLVLEVLLGPPDDRQQVLDLLLPHLAKDSQVWVHTLNLPSTVTVQAVPESFTAVGFGGLVPFGDRQVIELSRPRNSTANDLARAMGTVAALGFQPVEVDDSPGGVSARLFAQWVNTAAWLLQDGLLSAPAEVDSLLKRALGVELGPFALCDEVGLDVVEAVILGLAASFGLDRYPFCPMLTLRIEAGEIGKVTERGFYLP